MIVKMEARKPVTNAMETPEKQRIVSTILHGVPSPLATKSPGPHLSTPLFLSLSDLHLKQHRIIAQSGYSRKKHLTRTTQMDYTVYNTLALSDRFLSSHQHSSSFCIHPVHHQSYTIWSSIISYNQHLYIITIMPFESYF